MAWEAFRNDSKTIDTIIRNFEIMGEAAARMPEEFRKRHPEIPWAKIVGMRNKVAHEYFGVDAEIIWKTIQEDIPQLKAAVATLEPSH